MHGYAVAIDCGCVAQHRHTDDPRQLASASCKRSEATRVFNDNLLLQLARNDGRKGGAGAARCSTAAAAVVVASSAAAATAATASR